jgi:plasmid maintenance system antidote protein VapI
MTIESVIWLIKKGDIEVFSIALEQYLKVPGYTIYDRDNDDMTFLMHSVSTKREKHNSGHLAILKLLVEKGGVDLINAAQNISKRTALMIAAERGCTEDVYFLLSQQADLNKKDCLDLNALNTALHNNHYETAEALVHYGVDVEKVTNLGDLGRQGLYNMFWNALRRIPETMIGQNSSFLSKKYNQTLQKHPKITAKAMAKYIPLPQPLAHLVSLYLYKDEKLLNNFNKAIIFSLTQKAGSKKPNLRGGRRSRRRNGH